MHTETAKRQAGDDPLGLAELPLLEPERDDWPEIRAALEGDTAIRRPAWRRATPWLAAAASIAFAVLLVSRLGQPVGIEPVSQPEALAEAATEPESVTVDSMIALSQSLESQLRDWRERTVTMPAESAVYVAELEDLVAQVDHQLSYSPDSLNLWGQRINLLLDLAQMYQQQWERDYGLMASL